jgi:hypothetical protein
MQESNKGGMGSVMGGLLEDTLDTQTNTPFKSPSDMEIRRTAKTKRTTLRTQLSIHRRSEEASRFPMGRQVGTWGREGQVCAKSSIALACVLRSRGEGRSPAPVDSGQWTRPIIQRPDQLQWRSHVHAASENKGASCSDAAGRRAGRRARLPVERVV